MHPGLNAALALLAVLALIPLALWLLKRSRLVGAAPQGPMRLVAVLALAPNQRLMTVEVGTGADRQWLVLGVTPAGIAPVHAMPPQDAAAVTAPAAPWPSPFASLLTRQRKTSDPAIDAPSSAASVPTP